MKIGVVTSGGDAPGMNAAIRGVTRLAHFRNLKVLGFKRGWEGLIKNEYELLTPRSVGGIIQLGGTILLTSRCPEFRELEGIRRAAENLRSDGVDGLVVVGGNGSFRGALELSRLTDTLIVGVPASIDNDIYGTDETIGFDTALDTAIGEIDKIRDTAISHERTFIIEVMGRKRGFLAAAVGLTVGAEVILVPEVKFELSRIVDRLKKNSQSGKKSSIIVAAEGVGDNRKLGEEIERETGNEVRLSVLGYAQRGGSPTGRSRLLANLFAHEAVEMLLRKNGNEIICLRNGKIVGFDLEESCKTEKPLDPALLELAAILAT